ncbi:uncharacterized protein TM35_000015750 [Trypanosoma theileri]|uniref:Uncharacterized protein n=1 Tax=Trypanosoma theileri TaxID=67003 RepID=A0A1X0P9Y5_9TRYP|nr:uncharacterized protein TM35_000015750 [Trypanosoma theileri]ORC93698.1 hypothetical protein TM35_000015750 [Trypanosoma theileri]
MSPKENDKHDEMIDEMRRLQVSDDTSQELIVIQHVPLDRENIVRGILDMTLNAYAKQRKQYHISNISGKAALNEAGDKLLFFNIMQNVITLMGENNKLFLKEEFEVNKKRKTRADLVLMDENNKNILLIIEMKTVQIQYLIPLRNDSDITHSEKVVRRVIEEEFVKKECGPDWNELKSFHRVEKYCKIYQQDVQSNNSTGSDLNGSPRGRSIDVIFREAREQLQGYCEDAKKEYSGVDEAIKMVLCTVGPFIYKVYI